MVGITKSKTILTINLGKEAWALVCGTALALFVTRFKRRTMYLTCVTCMLIVYVGWTASMGSYMESVKRDKTKPNDVAGKLTLFWIFAYSPAYNIGYNALTYTYMVELMPYAERSRGLALFQFFGRGAGFFATFVNPIGLTNISWKYLLVYVCWICFELVIVFFFFPETYNRTLEELSFMFESKDLADKQILAVEKQIHHDDSGEVGDVKAAEESATVQQKELV
jgi:MFS family permease